MSIRLIIFMSLLSDIHNKGRQKRHKCSAGSYRSLAPPSARRGRMSARHLRRVQVNSVTVQAKASARVELKPKMKVDRM